MDDPSSLDLSEDDTGELTVHDTWLAIYITCILTLFQVFCFLLCFECCRRAKYVEDVFDRRRLVWPHRVPPPLMQKRGCLWGYLGMEWYYVRCSDEEYLRQAVHEYRDRMNKRRARQTMKAMRQGEKQSASYIDQNSFSVISSDFLSEQRRNSDITPAAAMTRRRTKESLRTDAQLLKAEKECWEESPFYFPEATSTLDYGVEDVGRGKTGGTCHDLDDDYFSDDDEYSEQIMPLSDVKDSSCNNDNDEIYLTLSDVKDGTHSNDDTAKTETTAQNKPKQAPSNSKLNASSDERGEPMDSSPYLKFKSMDDLIDAIVAGGSSKEEKNSSSVQGPLHVSSSRISDDPSTDRVDKNTTNRTQQTPDLMFDKPIKLNISKNLDQRTEPYVIFDDSFRTNPVESVEEDMPPPRARAKATLGDNTSKAMSKIPKENSKQMEKTTFSGARTMQRKQSQASDSTHEDGSSSASPSPTGGIRRAPGLQREMSDSLFSRSSSRRVRFDGNDSHSLNAEKESISPSPSSCLNQKVSSSNTGKLSSVTGTASSTQPPEDLPFRVSKTMSNRSIRYYDAGNLDWDAHLVTSLPERFFQFIKRRVLMLHEEECEVDEEEETEENEDDVVISPAPKGGQGPHKSTNFSRNVLRRPLSKEQAELLRSVGLDSFVMLQFLKFGFAISFWPFILSLFVLIPTYRMGNGDGIGFYTTLITHVGDESEKLWVVVAFVYVQVLFILRRLWVEWEVFLPLRHDFLERGDFIHQKYQDQYRKSCLVEYVPKTHRHDRTLFECFDCLFPGQVNRAELLLNTEYLRSLIKERLSYIKAYEDTYAKKVQQRADYHRKLDAYEDAKLLRKLRKPKRPPEPIEPVIYVDHFSLYAEEYVNGNVIKNAVSEDHDDGLGGVHTCNTLMYLKEEILRMNKNIEDEYIRLAQAKQRKFKEAKLGFCTKLLGLQYLMSLDKGYVHSNTAFVEFNTMAAKQQAIQCNLSGSNALMKIYPVPEFRDIVWNNAHVSKRLIDRRKKVLNVALIGLVLGWSILVAYIQSFRNISMYARGFGIRENSWAAALLDDYFPALLVETIVRIIAVILRYLAKWIRFKTGSDLDTYALKWYFAFRLITFIFVIVGGNLIDTGEMLLEDPVGFIRSISSDAAAQSEFFITYIMLAGALTVFYEFSQLHRVLLFYFVKKITKEEAISQRRLDKMRTRVTKFQLDEFIPLFLFIFMISALYGWIAPLSNLFVAIFFRCTYKVFKFMSLYVYANDYEGGGLLFYTLTRMVFSILYGLIIVSTGYFALFGDPVMPSIFSLLFFITIAVHSSIRKEFMDPSRTLSLTKAHQTDLEDTSPRERALKTFLKAKAFLEQYRDEDDSEKETERDGLIKKRVAPKSRIDISSKSVDASLPADATQSSQEIQKALAKFERRYRDNDCMSDITGDTESGARDFYIYRQPSLNRETWETVPRSYWETKESDFTKLDIWDVDGDVW